jgi:hypothetical protein
MSDTSLDVPWAATPVPVATHGSMGGVDILPGYAPDRTVGLPVVLDEPWSGRLISGQERPAVGSLNGMLLS